MKPKGQATEIKHVLLVTWKKTDKSMKWKKTTHITDLSVILQSWWNRLVQALKKDWTCDMILGHISLCYCYNWTHHPVRFSDMYIYTSYFQAVRKINLFTWQLQNLLFEALCPINMSIPLQLLPESLFSFAVGAIRPVLREGEPL